MPATTEITVVLFSLPDEFLWRLVGVIVELSASSKKGPTGFTREVAPGAWQHTLVLRPDLGLLPKWDMSVFTAMSILELSVRSS